MHLYYFEQNIFHFHHFSYSISINFNPIPCLLKNEMPPGRMGTAIYKHKKIETLSTTSTQ
jgi:hypothetical protein